MGCDGRDVHVSMCVILGVNIGAASHGNRNRVTRVCEMCEGRCTCIGNDDQFKVLYSVIIMIR